MLFEHNSINMVHWYGFDNITQLPVVYEIPYRRSKLNPNNFDCHFHSIFANLIALSAQILNYTFMNLMIYRKIRLSSFQCIQCHLCDLFCNNRSYLLSCFCLLLHIEQFKMNHKITWLYVAEYRVLRMWSKML